LISSFQKFQTEMHFSTTSQSYQLSETTKALKLKASIHPPGWMDGLVDGLYCIVLCLLHLYMN